MIQVEAVTNVQEVPTVINDNAGTSTEVLQIEEEDQVVVEEPQVSNSRSNFFLNKCLL